MAGNGRNLSDSPPHRAWVSRHCITRNLVVPQLPLFKLRFVSRCQRKYAFIHRGIAVELSQSVNCRSLSEAYSFATNMTDLRSTSAAPWVATSCHVFVPLRVLLAIGGRKADATSTGFEYSGVAIPVQLHGIIIALSSPC